MLERFSSSGVPKAPPALITVLARTSQSRPAGDRPFRESSWDAVVGSPARHASPVARPSSVRIRWTFTPALTRAPAATVLGRYETCAARFASIWQPRGQELHCTQRLAVRLIGPPL